MKHFYSTLTFKDIRILLVLLCFLLCTGLHAQDKYQKSDSVITQKTFPLIAYMERDAAIDKILLNDEQLKDLTLKQNVRLKKALDECGDVKCIASSLQWSPAEITEIGNRLVQLYTVKEQMRKWTANLKSSGYYSIYEPSGDTALLRAAWKSAASGINQALDVYIKGIKPRYFAIDAISFAENDEDFKKKIRDDLSGELKAAKNQVFYKMALNMVLKALTLNGRDEAGRYEPLSMGMNKSAFESIAKTDWNKYSYSAILVPGQGPEIEGQNIDPLGVFRCKKAAETYKMGFAPFIIVSGGHVHPNKTPFCEAVEMKKYLIDTLNVPEQAIFIEPHARHTTTNLRNAGRMIYRFNIPAGKKILIVTDANQNSLIMRMDMRCKMELGFVPYKELTKLSEETSEFYPVRDALQCNALDPLDP